MAQLNSLIVTGDSRFVNKINGSITGDAATVGGGYTVAKSVPSNAVFTDTNNAVTQTGTPTTTGYNANYEILFSNTADDTTRTEGARKSSIFKFNPYNGAFMCGKNTVAIGEGCHAEGTYTTASTTDTTAVQVGNHAEGDHTLAHALVGSAHAEGYKTTAYGTGSHAEGTSTSAPGHFSHAEGQQTTASGHHSHAEGYQTGATSSASHAEGSNTTVSGQSSHAEGYQSIASGKYSHAEGNMTTASGNYGSHAEGDSTKATHSSTHAEGYKTTASGTYSHAEGKQTIASGTEGSHAEGANTTASGQSSHVEGASTRALGLCNHAEGCNTYASNAYSHAGGYYTTANNGSSTAIGKLNAAMTTGGQVSNTTGTAFVIGKGTGASALSNAFSVQFNGVVKAASTITASTTADYAEYFEWSDENPQIEDRVGYFVTFNDGDKIRFATPEDDYILGVTSGEPFVLGNGDCDVWNGMFLRDEFRRIIYEPAPDYIEIKGGGRIPHLDKDGNPVYNGTRPKLNPNYDPTKPYINRADRPEWCPVGMLGVLAVRDDGTCEVNGYATITDNAVATKYTGQNQNKYRVIRRNTQNVVEIVFR